MSDSDEDLKTAIALSLQDDQAVLPKQKTPIIDLRSSDDEDDNLDAPVSTKEITSLHYPTQKKDDGFTKVITQNRDKPNGITSEGHGHLQKDLLSPSIDGPPVQGNSSKPEPPAVTYFLGLERKQMEAERLARVQQRRKRDEELLAGPIQPRKRKVSDSAPSGAEDGRHVKAKHSVSTSMVDKDIEKSSLQHSALTSSSQRPHSPLLRDSVSSKDVGARSTKSTQAPFAKVLTFKDQLRALQASGVQFPDGVVKRTWAYGCPREDDIKIEEVFQKNDLVFALLSAFQVDPGWVSSKLNEKTKVTWVLQAKDEREVSRWNVFSR